MTAEQVNAAAAVASLIIVAIAAVAAVVQLRHMSASNQIDALLALENDFRSDEVQSALRYVQGELPQHLADPLYRDELARIGFIDARKHPEIAACNWFNKIGTLLKHGLVSEGAFMDLFGKLIAYYWDALAPVVAIMRRRRGDGQYHDFEYLAMRARAWLAARPQGFYPSRVPRAQLSDPWLEADRLEVPAAPPPPLPADT